MKKKISDYGDILKREDIQEILKIGKNSTLELLKSNEIENFKVGRQYRVSKEALIKFLEAS